MESVELPAHRRHRIGFLYVGVVNTSPVFTVFIGIVKTQVNRPGLTPFCLLTLSSLVAVLSFPTAEAVGVPPSQQRQEMIRINPVQLQKVADSIIAEGMAKEHLPGAVFVVVKDGKIVLAKGYGYANLENKTPVIPSRTIFRIGSITKALTALAVTQLADRKKIDLEDDVNKYLDHPRVDQKYAEPVRFRHLLTHTGGFDQIGIDRQASRPEERKTLAEFLSTQLVRIRPPGQVSCYDTYGMTLAGYLVERISGLPYAEYMKQNIFAPLGMTRTNVETRETLKADLAVGYGYVDGKYVPQRYEYYVTTPASSIDATALDMAQLMIAVLGDGSTKSGRFLSPATARRIKQPQFTNHPGFPGFAHGFWEDFRNGQRAIHHGGNMLGFTTEMYLLPSHNLGFFVAYNRDEEAGGGPAVLRDTLTGKLMDHWFPSKTPEKEGVTQTPLQLDTARFAGKYAGTLYCHTCFDGEGWGWSLLSLRSGERGVLESSRRWLAVEPLVFQEENGVRRIAFREDKKGEITHLILGNSVYEKLGERLLTEVLGPGWQERPAQPLRARLYRDTEQWQKAAAAYASIIERRPNDGRAHYYLGFCRLNANEPDLALRAFERARELKRWPPFTAYYTAAAYARKGDKEQALTWLERAVKLGFSDDELMRRDAHLNSLLDDPRFKVLLKR